MAHVWCAFAGDDSTTEENLIGIYTSRTKAKRAVTAYFDFERGRWSKTTPDFLDSDWLQEQLQNWNAYGYVSCRAVQ